jgi:phosphoglycerate dehydrogenase-like enzyme
VISIQGLDINRITSTSEMALGLLLALVRRIRPATESVENGDWDRRHFIGRQLSGKTAGIIGMGRLGRIFARIVKAIGMDIVYYDPYVENGEGRRCESLAELASCSDVVSVHPKHTPETENLVGELFFEAARKGQFLVNTSRGAIIDEKALLKALQTGRLGGAALDVLRNEPETGEVISGALVDYAREHDNLIITPHIGGACEEAMRATEEIIAEEIIRQFC